MFALACAYAGRGLRRWHGTLIVSAYLAFTGMVLASAYSSPGGLIVSASLPVALGGVLAWSMTRRSGRRRQTAGDH